LWFNNEESGKKVKYRIIQSALGWTQHEIETNLLKAKEEAKSLLGGDDKIVVINKKDISIFEVEEMLGKYNPGLVVFDQLWKITGFEKESFSEAQQMTRLFGWGRKIAQEYAPVITVHQADGTAQGCQYIEMHQLYMSRVGIQGEADAIITLGRTYDAEYADTRWINVAKNKLDGGDRTDPGLRNGKFEITIDPYRARFSGVYKRP
jgi:replicative DNA helicase